MINQLLKPSIQQFIKDHEKSDPFDLSLKYKEIDGVPFTLIAHQINAHQKARVKIPEWYTADKLIYPPLISMEQCSSQITAEYKSRLFEGVRMVDLTGGAGVDTYYFSKQFKESHYVEMNDPLCEVAIHNFKQMGQDNIKVHNQTASAFLEDQQEPFDLIYLDPARRDNQKQKVFMLKDCSPNLVDILPQLKKKGKFILIKTSPLLDIEQCVHELGGVSEVYIISVNNDCKEVLYKIDNNSLEVNFKVHTVNFATEGMEEFNFNWSDKKEAVARYSEPLQYIYEPNSALLKSGAFDLLSKCYDVFKLEKNTHLYTDDQLISFPGRRFKIENIISYSRKALRGLGISKANVSVRNFPEDVNQIRKKLGLKDGGDVYLFAFTTLLNKKVIAVTCRV